MLIYLLLKVRYRKLVFLFQFVDLYFLTLLLLRDMIYSHFPFLIKPSFHLLFILFLKYGIHFRYEEKRKLTVYPIENYSSFYLKIKLILFINANYTLFG